MCFLVADKSLIVGLAVGVVVLFVVVAIIVVVVVVVLRRRRSRSARFYTKLLRIYHHIINKFKKNKRP